MPANAQTAQNTAQEAHNAPPAPVYAANAPDDATVRATPAGGSFNQPVTPPIAPPVNPAFNQPVIPPVIPPVNPAFNQPVGRPATPPVNPSLNISLNKKSGNGKLWAIVIVALSLAIVAIAAVVCVIVVYNRDDNSDTRPTDSYHETASDRDADDETTAAPATTQTVPPTTTAPTAAVPPALAQYADGLVEENNIYTVKLAQDDWNINMRSSPVYVTSGNKAANNVVGLIKSGSVIFVEYVYDGSWAVFEWNDQYVFVAIYDFTDPDRQQMLFKN